ncbi:hypothetical protein ACFX19_002918 [Malus domestica]
MACSEIKEATWPLGNQRGTFPRISKAGPFVQRSQRQQGHRFKDQKGTTIRISKDRLFQICQHLPHATSALRKSRVTLSKISDKVENA